MSELRRPLRTARKEIVNGNDATPVVVSLHELETSDGVPLILTRRHAPKVSAGAWPILLVHGLGQNRYSWHLSKRSLANYLVARGFDVFILELRGHGLSRTAGSPYPARFEEYVDHDVPAAVEAVLELSGRPQTFYAGHSFGGTIGYCLAPIQESLAGVVSFGGPGLFGAGNRAVQALGHVVRMLDRATLLRYAPIRSFPVEPFGALLKSILWYVDKPNRFPLQIWEPGSIDRAILEERLTKGFDRTGRGVIRQTYHWGTTQTFTCPDGGEDYTARLSAFTRPILFIQGDRDLVVPYESIQLCVEHMASTDLEVKTFNAEETGRHWGHLDIVLGDGAPDHTWPYLTDWMEARVPAVRGKKKGRAPKRAAARKAPQPEPAPEPATDDDEAFVGFTL